MGRLQEGQARRCFREKGPTWRRIRLQELGDMPAPEGEDPQARLRPCSATCDCAGPVNSQTTHGRQGEKPTQASVHGADAVSTIFTIFV